VQGIIVSVILNLVLREHWRRPLDLRFRCQNYPRNLSGLIPDRTVGGATVKIFDMTGVYLRDFINRRLIVLKAHTAAFDSSKGSCDLLECEDARPDVASTGNAVGSWVGPHMLGRPIDRFFGCWHRRGRFPITVRRGSRRSDGKLSDRSIRLCDGIAAKNVLATGKR
jgi:hypothetical protein